MKESLLIGAIISSIKHNEELLIIDKILLCETVTVTGYIAINKNGETALINKNWIKSVKSFGNNPTDFIIKK